MAKKMKVNDRISSMPDEVVCHILSFLPTKYAVGTSVLSTRWNNLFASLPNLDFDDSLLLNSEEVYTIDHRTFTNFVYRVLLIRNISRISTFRLKCKGSYDNDHINAWICTAIWRSVEQLDFRIIWNDSVTLPCQLFRCDTLVVLKLGSYIVLDVPSCVWFPRLKILDFHRIVLEGNDAVTRLFAGCPIIENVVMCNCLLRDVQVLDFSFTTLKSLTIDNVFDESDRYGIENYKYEIVVDAPLLEYFKYIDYPVDGYSLTNLDSLVEAHIDVEMIDQHVDLDSSYYGELVADIVAAISNVKVLHLSTKTMEALEYSNRLLPTFPNLTHLELGADHNVGRNLPLFLKSSYNLEKLSFVEGFIGQKFRRDRFANCLPEKVPDCLLLHLKDIVIREFTGEEDELKLVEYLLKSARVLNKMTIGFYSLSEKEQLCVCQKLSTFPRDSKTCQIVLD